MRYQNFIFASVLLLTTALDAAVITNTQKTDSQSPPSKLLSDAGLHPTLPEEEQMDTTFFEQSSDEPLTNANEEFEEDNDEFEEDKTQEFAISEH